MRTGKRTNTIPTPIPIPSSLSSSSILILIAALSLCISPLVASAHNVLPSSSIREGRWHHHLKHSSRLDDYGIDDEPKMSTRQCLASSIPRGGSDKYGTVKGEKDQEIGEKEGEMDEGKEGDVGDFEGEGEAVMEEEEEEDSILFTTNAHDLTEEEAIDAEEVDMQKEDGEGMMDNTVSGIESQGGDDGEDDVHYVDNGKEEEDEMQEVEPTSNSLQDDFAGDPSDEEEEDDDDDDFPPESWDNTEELSDELEDDDDGPSFTTTAAAAVETSYYRELSDADDGQLRDLDMNMETNEIERDETDIDIDALPIDGNDVGIDPYDVTTSTTPSETLQMGTEEDVNLDEVLDAYRNLETSEVEIAEVDDDDEEEDEDMDFEDVHGVTDIEEVLQESAVSLDEEGVRLEEEVEENVGDSATEQERSSVIGSDVTDDAENGQEEDVVDGQIGVYTDDDSTAFVDRMDLADAYDDDEDEEVPPPPSVTSTTASEETENGDTLAVTEEIEAVATDTAITATTPIAPSPPELTEIANLDNDRPTVQYMITRNMKRVLVRELGYKTAEVRDMKPDVAAVLVGKMLKRPKTGMPPEFYVPGRAPPLATMPNDDGKNYNDEGDVGTLRSKTFVGRMVRPALALAGVWGAATLVSTSNLDVVDSVKGWTLGSGRKTRLKESDSSPLSEEESSEDDEIDGVYIGETSAAFPSKDRKSTPVEMSPAQLEEHRRLVEEELKAAAARGKYNKDLDRTWLDKAITATLEGIDTIFRRPF